MTLHAVVTWPLTLHLNKARTENATFSLDQARAESEGGGGGRYLCDACLSRETSDSASPSETDAQSERGGQGGGGGGGSSNSASCAVAVDESIEKTDRTTEYRTKIRLGTKEDTAG